MFGYTITECYSEESAVLSFKHFCGRAFYCPSIYAGDANSEIPPRVHDLAG